MHYKIFAETKEKKLYFIKISVYLDGTHSDGHSTVQAEEY